MAVGSMFVEPLQGWHDFPFEPEGSLVDNEYRWTKGFGCGQNNIFSDFQGDPGFYLDGKWNVEIFTLFYHSRNSYKIDPLGEFESANDGGASKDDDIVLFARDILGQGHGSADMPQTVSIMGIHENIHWAPQMRGQGDVFSEKRRDKNIP